MFYICSYYQLYKKTYYNTQNTKKQIWLGQEGQWGGNKNQAQIAVRSMVGYSRNYHNSGKLQKPTTQQMGRYGRTCITYSHERGMHVYILEYVMVTCRT